MKSVAVVITAVAALWSSSGCAAEFETAGGPVATVTAVADGPSLADMSRIVESHGSSPFGIIGAWTADGPAEGRGKKPKPGQLAAAMAMSAGVSMLLMKATAAIKLFIIHSFFATKLGLVIGAYLLACKLMEMKSPPVKKVVKWVSAPAPSHFDEHSAGHYPEASAIPSSYEPYQEPQQQQQQPSYQQQHTPSDQYGPPPQVHQFMPSSEFGGGGGGGGGDIQAHYSHISPVTYRPVINRNQPDNKSAASPGRLR